MRYIPVSTYYTMHLGSLGSLNSQNGHNSHNNRSLDVGVGLLAGDHMMPQVSCPHRVIGPDPRRLQLGSTSIISLFFFSLSPLKHSIPLPA